MFCEAIENDAVFFFPKKVCFPKNVWLPVSSRVSLSLHHGEPFNVLRYQHGQKYDSHYDTFDPESYGPQSSQRIASFLLYLTDVEAGGETHFPLEGRDGGTRDGTVCTLQPPTVSKPSFLFTRTS